MSENEIDQKTDISPQVSGQIKVEEQPAQPNQVQEKPVKKASVEAQQQSQKLENINNIKMESKDEQKMMFTIAETQTDKVQILTSKESKKISKMMQNYQDLKKQYEKMRTNYESLRIEKDQFKASVQELSKKLKNVSSELENTKKQETEAKKQAQRKNIEVQTLLKRVQQYKKIEIAKQVLQQKVRQLGMIIDMTTKNAQQQKKAEDKWKNQVQKQRQLLRLEKQSMNSVRQELERLRIIEGETFVLKQQLVRIGAQYKHLKAQKEQLPIMMDKFQHQEHMISELKDTIKDMQIASKSAKHLNQKLQKKINELLQEKKQTQKKITKSQCALEEMQGQMEAIKQELQEERHDWEIQKKRYTTQIKTLKTELHKEHQKLKITEWQLTESKKKEKKPVQIQRVNIMSLSKQDLLNHLEQMEMKNQSLKLNINELADKMHNYEKKIKQQQAAIMALGRQITKDYPNLDESEGMAYIEKEIIEIGLSQKNDWPQIVEKVMIENLRLKDSVTALGEEYNQKLRKQLQK